MCYIESYQFLGSDVGQHERKHLPSCSLFAGGFYMIIKFELGGNGDS